MTFSAPAVNSANPAAVAGLGPNPPGPTPLKKRKRLRDVLRRPSPVMSISKVGRTITDR